MYSWKAIRAVCLVLLLLPIVHLVYLVSRDTMAVLDTSPEAWRGELEDYAREDSNNHLPEDPIVVVGGQRVKLWRDLPDLLAPRPVLMRGLGDATINDITFNYQRLVGYYRPDTVVFLPSNSEFHIRDNKSGEDLYRAIAEFVALDADHGITRRIYVITPIKTPLYPGDDGPIDQATTLLESWAADEERVEILDVNAMLSNGGGRPKPEYFRSDGVNLNESGYLRLSLLLQARIEQEELDSMQHTASR
jgi:hypothetical protein